MTEIQPILAADRPEPESKPRRRGGRWRPVFLILALLVLLLALFGPALLGQAALRLVGGGYTVTATSVGGPLWSPELRGVHVTGPGLNVSAGRAGAHLADLDLVHRTAHLDLTLKDTRANLNLRALLAKSGGAGGGFTLLPGKISVQNTRLSLDGSGFDLPSGQWNIGSVKQGVQNLLKVSGATGDGGLSALISFGSGKGGVAGRADIQTDARILNHFWHDAGGGAVRSGKISGSYTFGSGPVRGDLKLSGGSLAVPGASFVQVDAVAGTLTQRGDLLTLKLSGRGWNGPITATGRVDLKAQRWDIGAQATPLVSAMARSLGQTGAGSLQVSAHASGWNTVSVGVDITGGQGAFSALPYQRLSAHYSYERGKTQSLNALNFSADTTFQGQQRLQGLWNFNKSGTLAWTGTLLNQPLDLHGTIDANNTIAGSGRALGGPISGSLALGTKAVKLALSPNLYGVKGDLTARGSLSQLDLTLKNGGAGPVALAGQGRYDGAGFRADLGALTLRLNRQFRGTWQASGFDAAGIALSGSGVLDVPRASLTGTLAAKVPLLSAVPSGPVALNWQQRAVTWTFAGGQLGWQDQSFRVRANGLSALGYRLQGDVTVTTGLKVSGQLRATSGSTVITARGLGDHLALNASLGGVQLSAETSLGPGFATRARVVGSDISGTLALGGGGQSGVSFTLDTPGQHAIGSLNGQSWNAAGGVNLAALRPLLGSFGGQGDLSGTARLNLRGQGGTVAVQASGYGAALDGLFTRAGTTFTTRSTLRYAAGSSLDARAILSGRVYPDLDLSGPLALQTDATGPQTLRARLSGPYSAVKLTLNGRLSDLTLAGVSVPAQALALSGSLTPRLALAGRYGGLQVGYADSRVLLRGTQPFSGYGQSGSLTLDGAWAPGWQGQISASGSYGPYRAQISGPWTKLALALSGPNELKGSGSLDAASQRYDLRVRGAAAGLYVQGTVSGQGAKPVGDLTASDGAGGSARIRLTSLQDFSARSDGLSVAGQRIDGSLSAAGGLLSGQLRAGPLRISAQNGAFQASGTLAGYTLNASGRYALPTTLSALSVRVDGPYLSALASGNGHDLRGSVLVKGQKLALQGQPLLLLPAQMLPLRATLFPPGASLGGLRYAGGGWSGQTELAYSLGTAAGQVRLLGGGTRLSAQPRGPVTGTLGVLPRLEGDLSASLAVARPLLPAALKPLLTLGRLSAHILPASADLSLAGTRYAAQPLGLAAHLTWTGGVRASGLLSHPGTALRFGYDGRNLEVGGPLSALALRPFTGGLNGGDLRGSVQTSFSLPDLKLERASGTALIDLRSGSQSALGTLRVSGGTVSGDLSSTLGGQTVTARGSFYPQTDAALTLDGLKGRLTGDLRQQATLTVDGQYAGRSVNLRALGGLNPAALSVSGTVSGLSLDVRASHNGAALGDLTSWTLGGTVTAPDLAPLTGTAGQASATLGGTLADLRLNAAGQLAGADFTLPARYSGGELRIENASASVADSAGGKLVTAQLSGPVYPKLQLSGPLTLSDYLPGIYALAVTGPLSGPQVRLAGRTSGGARGLDAPGSAVQATLRGPEWTLSASGAQLSGSAHGRLSSNALGGVQQFRFKLAAPYRTGGTTLRLDGETGWQIGNGFSGTLQASGRLAGQDILAQVVGQRELNASAALGAARVSAQLPANVLFRPSGKLSFDTFDLGALWGRPNQLRLSGGGSFMGASWSSLEADLSGQLSDASGDLSGPLHASYRLGENGGDASLTLPGRRLQMSAALKAGEYRADLTSKGAGQLGAGLARLLPPSAGVSALSLDGSARLEGSLAGGLRQIVAEGLNLRGRQTQLGAFTLLGSARYTPALIEGDLSGTLLGGTLALKGGFPAGLEVRAQGLRPTAFGLDSLDADLTLSGDLANPALRGRLNMTRPELTAGINLSGSLNDPRLNAAADLRGGYAGRLLAEVRNLRLSPLGADLHVYGSAATQAKGQPANTVKLDLSGQWPKLSGTLQGKLAALNTPLTLSGDGTGGYALDAGALGTGRLTLTLPATGGLLPRISAAAHLTPLPLLPGASGAAGLDLALSGPLSRLIVSAQGSVPRAELSGVSLTGLSLKAAGALTGPNSGLDALSGTLSQAGKPVGELRGGHLSFSNLVAQGYGYQASATGRATLSGSGSADVRLSGAGVQAELKAAYAGGSVALSGTAAAAGFQASLSSTGSLKNGWTGTLDLAGGPAGVVTAPGHFRLSGALIQPLLSGTFGLGGAGVRVVASRRDVQLRLVDGPAARASGVLNLDLGKQLWEGQASYARPEASAAVKLSGALGDPQASLTVRRGTWTASGNASKAGADLKVSDGAAQGRLSWDGQTLGLNLPGLALGGLDLSGLTGTLTATGTLDTRSLDGSARLSLIGAQTGYTLPTVNLPLAGDLSADLTLQAGRVLADARLSAPYGNAALKLTQAQAGGPYGGRLQAQLKVNGGELGGDLTLNDAGLSGTLKGTGLNLSLGGVSARVSADAVLDGQSFTLTGNASSDAAGQNTTVSLSGNGGIADLLPQLSSYVAVKPTDAGYSLRASLSGLDVAGLKVAPNLSGKVSGEAAISDGGGTFVLRSAALKVGDTSLNVRVNGTLVGGDWRLRGLVSTPQAATSQLSGSLSDGVVSGTFQMSGLPVDALLSAFSGPLPGRGVLTGLARFQFPLSDPASGSLNVVAERLTISSTTAQLPDVPAAQSATAAQSASSAPATQSSAAPPTVTQTTVTQTTVTQTLAGSGSIDYAGRELRNIDLHLSGAGRWDVTGAYTHRQVGVTASFQNTTFTPVLSLIPSLRGLTPSLQGTLSLNVAGSYDRPVANVSGSDLSGALSTISLSLPSLSGQLQDSGSFSAQARLLSGGSLGSDGNLTVQGTLDSLKLRGLNVGFAGLLVPQGLGRIENVQATLMQVGADTPAEGYTVTAQAQGGLGVGSLSLQGSLSPRIDLKLSARNFNLPVSLIYGQQSRVNADLSAVEASSDPNAPINVSGSVNLDSLVLGRVGGSAVLPAPSSSGVVGSEAGNGQVNYASPLPQPLTEFPQTAQAQAARVSPFLSRVKFQDIPIHAPGGIRIDESIGRAELSGDLVLAGDGSAPTLQGEVKAIRGSVDLRDNTFTISSGSATFSGASLYPVFNVAAVGDVPLPRGGLVTINLGIDGRFVRQPDGSQALSLDTKLSCASGCVSSSADLSSANPNAEAQLYSLVAVGTPDLTTLPSNLGTLGTSALKTALNLFVLGEVQRNIARALGVDVFRVNAALPGENGSTSFGATFTVGSYLTRQLYLQYQVDLTGLGAIDATYTTPDNRLTFKASTPIQGLDLSTLRPSFSAAYNFSNRNSLEVGVKSGSSTQLSFGYVFRW
ncbi:translocation/assembly module TamB domain-containing protein [Deinococcus sp.]|uniref:translocation/assembly module TamB domain-containing protein n=1 Tax=Deinococcus sp. TaxID=47478 RepID=UPI003CC574B1